MRNFTKYTLGILLVLGIGLSYASEEEYKQLEVHVEECLDYLEVFTNPDYNPKKAIQKSYKNGSLVLDFNEEVVSQSEKLAEKWIHDCSDLFISDKYSPGFFKASPIYKVVTDRIKNQKFSKRNSSQSSNASSNAGNDQFKLRATFYQGYLNELSIITPYTTPFQYDYNGEHLIWGEFDDKDVLGVYWSKGSFAFSFNKSNDSLHYTSPFKTYTLEKDEKNIWGTMKPHPKIWEVKNVPEGATNGQFHYEKSLFAPIPKGNKKHSWAIKMAASLGLHMFAYTKDMIKDNDWVEDSTKYVSGFGTLGFTVDVSAGVVHCSPSSGNCFGFGAGYAHNGFDGYVPETDYWRKDEVKNKMKQVDNLKLYGEYYFGGPSTKGIRESIDIPLNASMKYLTSKTGFFIGKWYRYEFGLEISPIQYIPGIYINYGMSFNTPGLW